MRFAKWLARPRFNIWDATVSTGGAVTLLDRGHYIIAGLWLLVSSIISVHLESETGQRP